MPLFQFTSTGVLRRISLFGLLAVLTGVGFAQQTDTTAAAADTASGTAAPARAAQKDEATNGRRRNFDPAQMQQMMMDRMREQFGVSDDAEWKVITDRVTAVMEARRATGSFGGFAMFRAARNTDSAGGGGRRGFTASPEQEALRQAVKDNLPDAEIKARLERLREVHKANEEKLSKAQDDLRAVLTVRQEAVAVLFGLLP